MEECHFTKSNTPPCVFSTFFKLHKITKLRNASYVEVSRLISNPNQSTYLFR